MVAVATLQSSCFTTQFIFFLCIGIASKISNSWIKNKIFTWRETYLTNAALRFYFGGRRRVTPCQRWKNWILAFPETAENIFLSQAGAHTANLVTELKKFLLKKRQHDTITSVKSREIGLEIALSTSYDILSTSNRQSRNLSCISIPPPSKTLVWNIMICSFEKKKKTYLNATTAENFLIWWHWQSHHIRC